MEVDKADAGSSVGEEVGSQLGDDVTDTVRRKEGLTGPLQNPRIELARPGLTGEVSLDGMPQMPEQR